MPDSQYNVNITISSKDQSSGPTKKAAKSLLTLQNAAKAAAVAYGVLRTAQKAVDFAKAGAEIQRQEAALDSLAVSVGTTAKAIVGAIQTSSQFTIDRMTAMQVANRALVMEVAQTPAEFDKLTRTAVTLGRAMGMTATQSIDKFVLAIGRQSRLLADDFGLLVSSERAYKNFANANNLAADSLTLAQQKLAFFNDMMDQAEPKVAALGGVALDAAGQWEALGAVITNIKGSLSKHFSDMIADTGIFGVSLEQLTRIINNLNIALDNESGMLARTASAWETFGKVIPPAVMMRVLGEGIDYVSAALAGTTEELKQVSTIQGLYNYTLEQNSPIVDRLITGYNGYVAALESVGRATLENLSLFTTLHTASVFVTTDANRVSQADREAAQAARDRAASIAEQNRLMWDAQQAQSLYAERAREAAQVARDEAAVAADILSSEMERLRAETANVTIAQEAFSAQLMDTSPQQVATIMINMLTKAHLAGTLGQQAYRSAVQSLQIQFNLATPATIALAKAMGALNVALEGGQVDGAALGAELAGLAEFQKQQAEAAMNAATATAGAGAASRGAASASREHEAAIRAEQRALEAEERALRRSAEALMTRSQRLKEGKKETAAQLLIDDLAAQMDAGTISIDKYNRAVSQLMLGFGLATPESMQLATGLEVLLDAFTGGDIMSRELVAALNKLVGSTTGATTNNYNINDPTAGAIFSDQARASYAQSAGGG